MEENPHMSACPFCRTNDLLVIDGEPDTGYWVFCCTCSSSGPLSETQEEAILNWLTRDEDSAVDTFKVGSQRLKTLAN